MPAPRWPAALAEVFPIEPVGEDAFEVALPSHGGVSFGGDLLGCATLAAARSCPDRALHSLHASFVRPVPPETRLRLQLERVSDGRRIARRRVAIRSGEKLLFEQIASFAAPQPGAEYQDARAPNAPAPESLVSEEDLVQREGWEDYDPGPFEWRWIGLPWEVTGPVADGSYGCWIRPRLPMPDDPGLRGAAVAFLSDFHSHFPVARKLGGHFEPVGFASLDQALWIHRDRPWDDWWLLHSASDVAHGGRAHTRRSLYTRAGDLVATMAQEAVIPPA